MKKQRFLPPRSMAVVAILVVGLLGCEALQQAQHRRTDRLKIVTWKPRINLDHRQH